MKTLTLRQDKTLSLLTISLALTSEEVVNKIIDGLWELGVIENHFTDAGYTVKQVLAKNNIPLYEFLTSISLPYATGDIMKMVGELMLWGVSDQCPECGCEIETTTDGIDGLEWENHKCVNPNCNYSTTTEPDWDSMKGGKDYDTD